MARRWLANAVCGMAVAWMAVGTAVAEDSPYDPSVGLVSEGTEPTVNADGTLNVVIDAHAHLAASKGFGGYMFCGSPIGDMSTALAGCDSHSPGHLGSVLEAIVGNSSLTQPKDGYPDFSGWPNTNSLLHEAAYYKSIERLWKSGVGIVNLLFVHNRILCELYSGSYADCDGMQNIRNEAELATQMQYYIDQQNGGVGQGWFRIVRTPEEARRVVADGKLAVTLGVEDSEPFHCWEVADKPNCTKEDIDQGLDEWQAMGISGFFPIHKFDNALGGVRFDPNLTGAIFDIGQRIWYGHFWQAETCPDDAHDQPQLFANDELVQALDLFEQGALHKTLPPGTLLPVYPQGNVCNVRGLTDLGKYVVRQMMKRGMIIHVDHMSVKAARDTLDLAEQAGYPGVMSEHSWADPAITGRVIRDGGFAASYILYSAPGIPASEDPPFQEAWNINNAHAGPGHYSTAYGFSSDIDGLGTLPRAPTDNAEHPVVYPFTAINGAVFDREKYGTRSFDYNTDGGVETYGMLAEWMSDVLQRAGDQRAELKRELLASGEAYVSMWEHTLQWADGHH